MLQSSFLNPRTCLAATFVLAFTFACQQRPSHAPPELPDLNDAFQEVRELLELKHAELVSKPESAAAWGQYGLALDAHEYPEEAAECYRVASMLAPNQIRWKYLLAIKLKDESPSQAEALLAGITDKPNVGIAELLYHVDVLTEIGRLDAADRLLQVANVRYPSQPAVMYRLARRAFEQGDLDAVRRNLDALPAKFRETDRLRTRLMGIDGVPLVAVSETQASSLPSVDQTVDDRHRTAVRNSRRDPLWRGKQAADQANNGNRLAMMSLMGLVKKHPELVDNRLQLALLTAEGNNHEQADQILREGLELAPRMPRLLSGLAALAMMRKDWGEAKVRLESLLSIAPDHKDGWSDLGFTLEQLSETDAAISAYDKALSIDPGDTEIANRRSALRKRKEADSQSGSLPQ